MPHDHRRWRRLEALEREWDANSGLPHPNQHGHAILLQVFGPRPAAELDAFADRLDGMMADTTLPKHVRSNAGSVLVRATSDGGVGTPYLRAFDFLVRAHEDGADVLTTIFRADPERGPAYVRHVFERIERPPLCPSSGELLPECVDGYSTFHETPWCRAGDLLYRDIVAEARQRTWPGDITMVVAGDPDPVPDGLPEHVEDWHRRCK
ncbi:MAG: hypothetical protein J4F34_00770 [Gemmatimonadetes bacterium]|nr:hypothetical protein [Gemmatimonadota bacterium]